MGQTAPDFGKVRQFTRLTMMMTPTSIHSVINLSGKAGEKATKILNTYDLVAMRPDPKQNKQETIYEQVFTKGDGDIISLELS